MIIVRAKFVKIPEVDTSMIIVGAKFGKIPEDVMTIARKIRVRRKI
jgi:hypothetical protein